MKIPKVRMGENSHWTIEFMSMFSNFFRRSKLLSESDLVKPYSRKVQEALSCEDLPRAIAYLECGIKLAPTMLGLYLQRAQILQYGLNDCAAALKDYRFILRELERAPNEELAAKCRSGMKDMMGAVAV